MVVNGQTLNRAVKRRVTADLYDFRTFASLPGGDGTAARWGPPFRSNIGSFLAKYGRLTPSALMSMWPHLVTWRLGFGMGIDDDDYHNDVDMDDSEGDGDGDGIVVMDVVEEDVRNTRSVYCDHCRVVGWSGHPVCRKRYHFIIRNKSNPLSGYKQMCTCCGSVLHVLDSRCMACKYEMTAEDFEDWAYRQLEDPTHLLHGVVHANGYGHLLRVNGREGGSKYLTGCDIMGFWDRLCKLLRVRKVTVMDKSRKYGMEYRLLHAVTAGHPWYGDWGYEFGAGCYALTFEAYQKALKSLSNTRLSSFFFHSRSPRTPLENAIAFYWSLSDRQLETVKDLFCHITHLLHESHEQSQPRATPSRKKLRRSIPEEGTLCAWTKVDVERAKEAMVKVLRAVGRTRWVTWHALRGASCRTFASPELQDYCLKELGGEIVDNDMIVVVRCNPENRAIEYRLEAASKQLMPMRYPIKPLAEQVLLDLRFLYNALLNPTSMHAYKLPAVRESACSSAANLLDCKQFIKNYDKHFPNLVLLNPVLLYVWCHVELVNQLEDYTAPPPELLVLPITATIADVKLQATKAFKDTYLIFESFEAEQLLGYGDVDECTNLKLLLGANRSIRVRGRCFGDEHWLGQFRMERGLENWIVDCACGAKDDDGERMLACDVCGVWQHTRCIGISEYDSVPVRYVCKKCSGANKSKGRAGSNRKYKDNGMCKGEVLLSSLVEVESYGWMTTVG